MPGLQEPAAVPSAVRGCWDHTSVLLGKHFTSEPSPKPLEQSSLKRICKGRKQVLGKQFPTPFTPPLRALKGHHPAASRMTSWHKRLDIWSRDGVSQSLSDRCPLAKLTQDSRPGANLPAMKHPEHLSSHIGWPQHLPLQTGMQRCTGTSNIRRRLGRLGDTEVTSKMAWLCLRE